MIRRARRPPVTVFTDTFFDVTKIVVATGRHNRLSDSIGIA